MKVQYTWAGLLERLASGLLRRLNSDALGRLRVSAESAVIASGTVTTVTNVTNMGTGSTGLQTATSKAQTETLTTAQSGVRNRFANTATAMGVLVNNGAAGAAVNIQDGGNSITVDGGVTATLDAASHTHLENVDTATTAMNAKFVSGTDIGDVTINNAGAGNAVNIQDGNNSITVDDGGLTLSIDDNGSSITVDGTVDATLDAASHTHLENIDTATTAMNAKFVSGTDIGDVTINNAGAGNAVNIQDGGNSITVDGTVTASLDAASHAHLENIETNTNLPSTQNVYNITMVSADTEYSQALPAATKSFMFRCRTDFAVRYSFTTGKVATPTAPYMTLPAGAIYSMDGVSLTGKTIYFACDDAGKEVELEAWN